jgi:F-type H+-transporting ATPase subunit c
VGRTRQRRQPSPRYSIALDCAQVGWRDSLGLTKTEELVSKRAAVVAGLMMLVAVVLVAPVSAQGAAQPGGGGGGLDYVVASILTAGFALGIAAGLAGIGQGKAIASAAEAIARNPSASGDIRGSLILGLVFIESLVIYVLFIALTLFFFNPFKPAA